MKKLKYGKFLPVLVSVCLICGGCGRKEADFLALEEMSSNERKEGDAPPGGEEQTSSEERTSESGGIKAASSEGNGSEAAGSEGNDSEATGSEGNGSKATGSEGAVSPEQQEIYVDVCGAVAKPGVYTLPAGSRVFQAVECAGGLLPGAARQYINQAGSLTDGQQIYVPTKKEVKNGTAGEKTKAEGTEQSGESGSQGKIDLNSAGLEELMTLTGIGESKARAILDYREEHGGFASVEELCQVQGIKEGTFLKIKDKIAVE